MGVAEPSRESSLADPSPALALSDGSLWPAWVSHLICGRHPTFAQPRVITSAREGKVGSSSGPIQALLPDPNKT